MNVLIVVMLPLAALALLVRVLLLQPFDTPSTSMAPNLVVGDQFFAAKYAYGYSRFSLPFSPPLFPGRILGGRPAYGDIVVFRLKDGVTDYVKRVVGLPGDRIQMRAGHLHINGGPVPRDLVLSADACGRGAPGSKRWRERMPNGVVFETLDCFDGAIFDDTPEYLVPPEHYFMMGDNRDNSSDSRAMATVGFVPAENLVGRFALVFARGASEP